MFHGRINDIVAKKMCDQKKSFVFFFFFFDTKRKTDAHFENRDEFSTQRFCVSDVNTQLLLAFTICACRIL